MSRICEEAGIAKGTIFRYFPTREAMFKEIFDNCKAHAFELAAQGLNVQTDAQQSNSQILTAMVRRAFDWPLTYPLEFQFVVLYTDATSFFALDEQEPEGLIFNIWGNTQLKEIAQQCLKPGIDPVLLERFLSAQVNTACRYLISRPAPLSEEEINTIAKTICDSVFTV